MNLHLHLLTAGVPSLATQQKLRQSIHTALARIQRSLVSPHLIDIICYVNPQTTIPEIGIGGYTPNAQTIFISLDPHHPKFTPSIRVALPRTIAHELHHAVRWADPGYGQTLGEALVTEGLAAHFELEVFGGKPNLWDIAVRGQELLRLKKRAAGEMSTSRYNHNDWFFGSQKRHLPRWTGYSLGFQIVQKYLSKNRQSLPSRLVNVNASEILLRGLQTNTPSH